MKRTWVSALLLFCFAFAFFAGLLNVYDLTIFQARDIHRAAGLLHGQWIWHGPELLTGEYTPGPFYYWLLAGPLALSGAWESLPWFCVLLASLAAVGAWEFGVRWFSAFAGLLFFFFILNSSLIRDVVIRFWNPSFLPFFQILTLLLLYDPVRAPRGRLIAGSVLLGLSLQIHYMQLVFVAGTLLAIGLDPIASRANRLRRMALVAAFVALPLLPYAVWRFGNIGSAQAVHSSVVAWKAMLAPIQGITENGFTGLTTAATALGVFLSQGLEPFIFPLIGIWVWGARRYFPKARKPGDLFLWCSLACGVPLLLNIVSAAPPPRYVLPFFTVFYALSAPVAASFKKAYPRLFLTFLALALGVAILRTTPFDWLGVGSLRNGALLVLAAAIAFSAGKSERSAIVLLLALTLATSQILLPNRGRGPALLRHLAEKLAKRTGWSYEVLSERIYFGELPRWADFSLLYGEALRLRGPGTVSDASPLDGILVFRRGRRGFPSGVGIAGIPDWEQLRSRIPDEMYRAGLDSKLSCVAVEDSGPYHICYYRFSDRSYSRVTWNNLGYPYSSGPPAPLEPRNAVGAIGTGRGSGVLYVNDCPGRELSCTVFFKVEPDPSGGAIEVTAFGEPISVPNLIDVAWTASMEDVTLSVACGGGQTETYILASTLGSAADTGRPYFLAPYRARFPLSARCRHPSEVSISASRGLTVRNVYFRTPLEPFRVAWKP